MPAEFPVPVGCGAYHFVLVLQSCPDRCSISPDFLLGQDLCDEEAERPQPGLLGAAHCCADHTVHQRVLCFVSATQLCYSLRSCLHRVLLALCWRQAVCCTWYALMYDHRHAPDYVSMRLNPEQETGYSVFITHARVLPLLLRLHHCSTKGAAKSLGNTWSASKAAWISALIAVGTAFLTGILVVPLLMRQSRKHIEAVEARAKQEAEQNR